MKVQVCASLFGQVQQADVQVTTVDRPDDFRVITAVTLQLQHAFARVHHAPAHHHRLAHHRVIGIRLAQGMAPTLGQCQVDGATALVAFQTRITTLFVHMHLPTTAGEQGGQQGAGQACADEGDGACARSGQD